ncbi:hypothetical protein [Archangium lipolyticum]|uniref:hypothetical protein n=1 Tax=Archangium lipolyticum TaxID=2970465 RepID=UPI00214A45D7|nr:hypothetical protein [Archangium lipolyticum]
MKLATPLRSLRFVTALALPLLAGCDPDDTTDPGGPSTGPLYAITTQILTADEPVSYILLTDKVDHTEPLALDEKAIEVPGRALGVGIPKSGHLYVAGDEGATVTRYTLSSDGRLVPSGVVSFAGKGVSSIGEYQSQFQFVSPTKAYYFDGRTSQAIVWNPSDMTVTGSINLTGISVEGAILTFSAVPIRRENQVIMPLGWRPATGIGIVKQAGVVVIDTRTDTATIVKDDRCGYVREGVVGPDGMVYIATEVYGSAVRRMAGENTPVPCVLKFDPQTLKFDPSFFVELSTLAKGSTAGTLFPGSNGNVYLRVLDESIYTVKDGTHPRLVASAPAWKWWKVEFNPLSATPVASLPASTGSSFLYQADDRLLFSEFASGSTATSLRELTDQSGKVTTTFQGVAFSFLQVR